MSLPQGTLGYAWQKEDFAELEQGIEPLLLAADFAKEVPSFNAQINPLDVVTIKNQGSVGACQGFSLSTVFEICYFLATGRKETFSAACGYYIAQRHDGIRGDRGSTLSGGRYCAQEFGMCLDSDWPFSGRYDPRQPSGAKFDYKLKVSKPFREADEVFEWLRLGLPIQIGVRWCSAYNREVIDSACTSGGGHAITLWCMDGDNVKLINSWGSWSPDGDGTVALTPNAVRKMLRAGGTFLGYSPFPQMEYPTPDPIN